jgi:hypothetical protein
MRRSIPTSKSCTILCRRVAGLCRPLAIATAGYACRVAESAVRHLGQSKLRLGAGRESRGGATRLLFCLCLLVSVSPANDSLNCRLLGAYHMPSTILPTGVAVSGDYAYLTCRVDPPDTQRLIVISVVDPTQPVEVGHCAAPSPTHGVAVAGGYAYVAAGDAGLRVVSIADPTSPVEVGYCDTFDRAIAVAVEGSCAYVSDQFSHGLRVISVVDPAHPVQVGYCESLSHPGGVVLRGEYAYVGANDFSIVSIADPWQPSVVGKLPGRGGDRVAVNGNYAYVGTWVIRIADAAHPIDVGTFGEACGGIAVTGNHAYVAAGASGLEVYSLADPGSPVRVGYYRQPGRDAVAVAVAGDYVYVATEPAGLQVFQYYGEGIEENGEPQTSRPKPGPTVIRSLPAGALAFDAMGRRVLSLKPGVLFVRMTAYEERSAAGMRKVVVAK